MRRKFVAVVLALVVFGCCSSVNVQAQIDSCPQYDALLKSHPSCLDGWPPLDFAHLPPTAVCCNPNGTPFGESCLAAKSSCSPPPSAAQEVCVACNRGLTPSASAPIDLATGNTYIVQTDMSVPGLGGGLSLTRTWNSLLPDAQNSYPFMFGLKWRSNFEERLVLNSPDFFLKYLRNDGSVWSYGVAAEGAQPRYSSVAPANDTSGSQVIRSLVDPTYTLSSKSGVKKVFNMNTGALLSIADRNGNVTTLSYDSAGRLATVTDPASRHLYFNYANGSTPLVSSVTSDVGLTTSYAYDAQGRLTQMTRPDGTTVSFEYNAQSLITAVKDSDGKVLEAHTYDAAGRGLTGTRANGVDSVTISYPQ
jgi:YD repeat-containing protein